MVTYNTIMLKGSPQRREGLASGAITPGHLLEYTSAAADTFIVHATAAGNNNRIFAAENEIGVGYAGPEAPTIDTAYASGAMILAFLFRPGEEVYALLAAAATAVVKGAYLESAGDGTLRTTTAAAATANTARNGIVAQAMESVDNSAGGTAARIRVMIV